MRIDRMRIDRLRIDRMRCHRSAGVVAILGVAMLAAACDTASGPAQGSGSLSGSPSPSPTSSASTATSSSTSAPSSAPTKQAPTASSASPAGVPSCTSADLSTGSWKEIVGSAGAGQVSADLAVQNTSKHACTVKGFPRITLSAASGKALPTTVTEVDPGGATQLTVAPGGWIRSELRYSPDIPGPGEPQSGPCEPAAVSARVQLPGDTGSVPIPITPPTSVCSGGTMQAKAFAAGAASAPGG